MGAEDPRLLSLSALVSATTLESGQHLFVLRKAFSFWTHTTPLFSDVRVSEIPPRYVFGVFKGYSQAKHGGVHL